MILPLISIDPIARLLVHIFFSSASSYLLSFARFTAIIFASWLMFIPAGKARSRH